MLRAVKTFLLVLLSLFFELLLLLFAVATWPFVTLDNRWGWTLRARCQRAREALGKEPATSIGEATGSGRAVFEGTLEAAGPLVRVPIVDREALGWCVWAIDGGLIRFIDGEMTAIDLADGTGRLRLELVGAHDLEYGLGERAPISEVTQAWRARGGASVDEWTLSWVPVGSAARASGKVVLVPPSERPYREPAQVCSLGASDDGVPLLLRAHTSHPLESKVGPGAG